MNFTQAAAEYGEILGKYIDQPPIDGSPAGYNAVARIFLFFQSKIVGAMDNKRVSFMERTFIQQKVKAFTGGQFTLFVLGFDPIRTAALAGAGFSVTQVLEFRVNAHKHLS